MASGWGNLNAASVALCTQSRHLRASVAFALLSIAAPRFRSLVVRFHDDILYLDVVTIGC